MSTFKLHMLGAKCVMVLGRERNWLLFLANEMLYCASEV